MATRKRTSRSRKASTRSYRRKGGSVWSREEISFLRKHYRNHSTAWCAKQLGRTVYAVRYKASDLSIKKANPSKWVDVTSTTRKTSSKKSRRSTSRTRWAKPTSRRSSSRKSSSRKSKTRKASSRKSTARKASSRKSSARRTSKSRRSTRRSARR